MAIPLKSKLEEKAENFANKFHSLGFAIGLLIPAAVYYLKNNASSCTTYVQGLPIHHSKSDVELMTAVLLTMALGGFVGSELGNACYSLGKGLYKFIRS